MSNFKTRETVHQWLEKVLAYVKSCPVEELNEHFCKEQGASGIMDGNLIEEHLKECKRDQVEVYKEIEGLKDKYKSFYLMQSNMLYSALNSVCFSYSQDGVLCFGIPDQYMNAFEHIADHLAEAGFLEKVRHNLYKEVIPLVVMK